MRGEKEGRKKQARTNKQGKATQRTHVYFNVPPVSPVYYLSLLYTECVTFVLSQIVGQLGTIQGTNNNGNIIVFMKGQPWILNPFCVKMAEKGEEQEVSSEYADTLCAVLFQHSFHFVYKPKSVMKLF